MTKSQKRAAFKAGTSAGRAAGVSDAQWSEEAGENILPDGHLDSGLEAIFDYQSIEEWLSN